MPFDSSTPQSSANVVGGGISGLTSAMELVDAGYKVDIWGADKRTGGKIESAMLGGQVVNLGAEFIDSTQTGLINLCNKLGVKLVEAKDQGDMKFLLPDGRVVTDDSFFSAARPLKEKIARDKALVASNPTGPLAKKLDSMPLDQYLNQLTQEATVEQKPGFFARAYAWAKGLVSRNKPIELTAAAVTLGRAYCSEAGRDPGQISTLQFLRESSAKLDTLLDSDCGYRVEGGTEQIIKKLEQYVTERGAQIHLNSKVMGVEKNADGKFALTLEDGSTPPASDKVVLGLPMHALGQLRGLEALGFSRDDVAFMNDGQYTHNAKFTIKLKPGVANDDLLISSDGFQTWRSSPDTMTFLIGGEALNKLRGGNLVDYCLDKYAAANNTTPDALFDKSQIVFRGPQPSLPCYASPGASQALRSTAFADKARALAENGVGVVGTYLPTAEGSVGFMECGVEAARTNIGILTGKTRTQALEQQQGVAAPAPDGADRPLTHVERYAQRNAASAALAQGR